MQTREIRQITLQPGEYAIKELVWGLDFIVVQDGELKGQTFAIWEEWLNNFVNDGKVPITHLLQRVAQLAYAVALETKHHGRRRLQPSACDGPIPGRSPHQDLLHRQEA